MNEIGLAHFCHVTLRCRDIERTTHFYHECLGFDILHREVTEGPAIEMATGTPGAKVHHVRLKFPGDNVCIDLTQGSGAVNDSPATVDSAIFCLRVNNAEVAHKALIEMGIQPNQAVQTFKNQAKLFFVNDPDGRRVEILEALAGLPGK